MKNLAQAMMIWMAAFVLFTGMSARAEDTAAAPAPVASAEKPVQADQNDADAEEKGPPFLANAEITLSAPPANDSAETKAEIAELLKAQSEQRTPQVIAAIKSEENADNLTVTDAPLSPKVQYAVAQADETVKFFALKAKKQFNRPRPSALEPKLITVVPVPSNAAYPSGHAARGYMAALIMETLDPANKDKYEARGLAIGQHRIVAGVHYFSDVKAGVELAKIVFSQLMDDPEYLKVFNAAQEEFNANNKIQTN